MVHRKQLRITNRTAQHWTDSPLEEDWCECTIITTRWLQFHPLSSHNTRATYFGRYIGKICWATNHQTTTTHRRRWRRRRWFVYSNFHSVPFLRLFPVKKHISYKFRVGFLLGSRQFSIFTSTNGGAILLFFFSLYRAHNTASTASHPLCHSNHLLPNRFLLPLFAL